mgnify:CR=1 FL=1
MPVSQETRSGNRLLFSPYRCFRGGYRVSCGARPFMAIPHKLTVQMCRRISRQAIQAEAAGAALLPTKFVKHNGQANMPSRRKPRTLRCCLKQSTKEYQMDIGYLSRRITDSHRFITAFAEYSPPSRDYSQSARHRPARSAAGLSHRDHAA